MEKLLVVGLNPAWQKMLRFRELAKGRVNRAGELHAFAAGKGRNVAMVLSHLGYEVTLLQILGGETGGKILSDCCRHGIQSLHVEVKEETRTCTTLLETSTGLDTEIIEPFSIQVPGIHEEIIRLLQKSGQRFDLVLYCGTSPDGCPPAIYEKIQDFLSPPLSLLDSYQGLSISLLRKVTAVKVNRSEWSSLIAEQDNLLGVLEAKEAASIFLTDGSRAARFLEFRSGRGWETSAFTLPRLDQVINPIGAGDTCTAGLAHGLLHGLQPAEAFRLGLSTASASCLTLLPGEYDEAQRAAIETGIRLEKKTGLEF